MKSTSLRLLQVYLWFICIFHLMVGIGVSVSSGFPARVAAYYGARVDWTPQFTYILKPLGAFMVVLGLLGIAAAMDPLKHRLIAYGFAGVFVIRTLQRIVFMQQLQDAFAIEPGRNLLHIVLFSAMAVALFALQRRAERDAANA